MRYTVWQWSRLGRWADKSARPELVEGRAVGCSWFDRLTTSVGTDIGAQQTSVLSQPRVANYPERGARLARREERAYREYVSDEQRSQARGPQRGSRVGVEEGCPARELCDESLLRDTSSPWCNSICIRAALHPAHHPSVRRRSCTTDCQVICELMSRWRSRRSFHNLNRLTDD